MRVKSNVSKSRVLILCLEFPRACHTALDSKTAPVFSQASQTDHTGFISVAITLSRVLCSAWAQKVSVLSDNLFLYW